MRKVSHNRVIGVAHCLPPQTKFGGAEFTVDEVVNLLVSKDYKVEFLSLESEISTRIINSKNIHYTILPILNIYRLFGKERNLVKRLLWHIVEIFPRHIIPIMIWLRKKNVNLLLVHNEYGFGSSLHLAAKLLRIPVMKFLHDYSYGCFKGMRFRKTICERTCITCKLKVKLNSIAVPSVFVGVSENMISWIVREQAITKQQRKPLILYPNISIKTKYFPKREYKFGYIGRIAPEKGLEKVLIALQEMNETLFVAGDCENKFSHFLKSAFSNVHFLGRQSPEDFLGNLEILVVPSLWSEPFGRVIVEGGISGCKLVYPSHPGMIEAGNVINCPKFIYSPSDEIDFRLKLQAAKEFQVQNAPSLHSKIFENQRLDFINCIDKLFIR